MHVVKDDQRWVHGSALRGAWNLRHGVRWNLTAAYGFLRAGTAYTTSEATLKAQ